MKWRHRDPRLWTRRVSRRLRLHALIAERNGKYYGAVVVSWLHAIETVAGDPTDHMCVRHCWHDGRYPFVADTLERAMMLVDADASEKAASERAWLEEAWARWREVKP